MPSGSAAKASSVGAKTVSGPSPASASTRPAACTAVTRVVKRPSATAMSTIVPGCSAAGSSAGASVGSAAVSSGAGGSKTASMTWMVPFDASMSAITTWASLMRTTSPSTEMLSEPPCSVSADSRVTTSAAFTSPDTTW